MKQNKPCTQCGNIVEINSSRTQDRLVQVTYNTYLCALCRYNALLDHAFKVRIEHKLFDGV